MTIDHPGDLYLADVTFETRAVAAGIVEYRIDREYGKVDDDGLRGATMLALAAIKMDINRRYVALNGSEDRIDGLADSLLRLLVAEGLDARRCQCPVTDPNQLVGHDHSGPCEGHYEADVPAIDGARLCGTCHVAVAAVLHTNPRRRTYPCQT